MLSLDNTLIKRAHSTTEFTDAEILHIAKCMDPITGPLYFMSNFFNIQHPIKGRMMYEPFDFQRELIDVYTHNRFSINLLSRQTGKCLINKTIINVPNNFINSTNSAIIKGLTTKQQIGDLLWKDLTIKQKVVTKLEDWLVKLVKLEDVI